MANLTPYDPFGDLGRLDPFRAMDDIMRDLRPGWGTRELANQPSMRLDVHESEQAYTVRAEIPGVKKEDIRVDVQGNHVSIMAECKRDESHGSGTSMVRGERYYGQVSRSFTLGSEVDDDKAEAKYVDGILELTLPKKEGNGGRRLQIH